MFRVCAACLGYYRSGAASLAAIALDRARARWPS